MRKSNFYYLFQLFILMNGLVFSGSFAHADSHFPNTHFWEAQKSNWYFQTSLGTHMDFSANTQIPSIFSKPPLESQPVYAKGSALDFHLGYVFSKPFRIEAEMAYKHLPMRKIQNAIGYGTVTDLNESYTDVFSLFLNGLYDFHFCDSPIFPYVGLGAGYVYIQNQIRPDPIIPVGGGIFFTQKKLTQSTLGYQGMIGLAYSFSKSLRLGLDYRYLQTQARWTRGQTNLGKDSYLTKQKITDSMLALNLMYFFN